MTSVTLLGYVNDQLKEVVFRAVCWLASWASITNFTIEALQRLNYSTMMYSSRYYSSVDDDDHSAGDKRFWESLLNLLYLI